MAYAHKTSYSREALEMAVTAVRRQTLTVRKAAQEYGVPRSSLHDKVRGKHERGSGRDRDLSDEDEVALANYIRFMANQGLPATREIVGQKVTQMLQATGIIFT